MMTKRHLPDLTETYLSLGDGGRIEQTTGGDAFWSLPAAEIEEFGKDWLITEFSFDEDWRSWEMHPNGEEIVYMLSGAMDLILEKDGERETIEVRGKGLVVVPRGTWHTAKVFEPCSILVITHGEETQIRPIE